MEIILSILRKIRLSVGPDAWGAYQWRDQTKGQIEPGVVSVVGCSDITTTDDDDNPFLVVAHSNNDSFAVLGTAFSVAVSLALPFTWTRMENAVAGPSSLTRQTPASTNNYAVSPLGSPNTRGHPPISFPVVYLPPPGMSSRLYSIYFFFVCFGGKVVCSRLNAWITSHSGR